MTNIAPAPRGTAQIQVTFKVDEAGILSVTAKDTASSKENSIQIKNSKGRLSEAEIEAAIKEAE